MPSFNGFMARRTTPRAPYAAGASAFTAVTQLKSDTSGEHWLSPFGIPIPKGVTISDARRTKFFARYGGNLYPIQTEQFRSHADGYLIHMTGHVKLPSSYVAEDLVEIGYSDTETVPAVPTYPAATDDIEVTFTIKEPRVHWISLGSAFTLYPYSGDRLVINITDSLGTQTYYQDYAIGFSNFGPYQRPQSDNQLSYTSLLMKQISQDPAGRYTCYRGLVAPEKEWNRPEFTTRDQGYDERFSPFYAGGVITHQIGTRGRDIQINPYANDTKTQQWPQAGFFIFPRAGTPIENYTVTATFQRNGTRIPVTNKALLRDTTPGATDPGVWKRLNYRSRSATFTTSGWLVGLTSGTRCRFIADNVSIGTTGQFKVNCVYGTGFVDGETLQAYNINRQTLSGSAVVDGSIAYDMITSSSGGSARFLSFDDGNYIYVSDISGEFNTGDTLTSPYGSTTQSNTTEASPASVYTSYSTYAQSGTITPINDIVASFIRTVTFNAATATADSPWFDGHQVRQVEKRIAVPDTDLDVLFYVSWNRDGTVIDRQIVVENSRICGNARDWWYDVDISIGGVPQVVGLPQYDLMYHHVWSSWRWRQEKPFGMCDPADFMLARIIHPWRRYPTWDAEYDLNCFVLGGNAQSENNYRMRDTGSNAYPHIAGVVQSEYNLPLYAGNYFFSGSGGQRPELGDFNTTEYGFWASDSALSWPVIEAMADNVMAACGYWARHEIATGEDAYNNPNFYTSWMLYPSGSNSAVAPSYAIGKPFNSATSATLRQRYTLMPRFNPTNSHSCSPGHFTAFMVRPEKRFFDGCKLFAWYQALSTQGNNLINPPALGEPAGGDGHKLGVQTFNGIRSFARPARDIGYAAFVHHEGARQRDMWRRAAGDQASFANDLSALAIWGILFRPASNYTATNSYNAATWVEQAPVLLPGYSVPASMAPNPYLINIDYFKELYVNTTMAAFQHLGVADVSGYLGRNNWFINSVQYAPHGNWWNGVLGNVNNTNFVFLAKNLTWDSTVNDVKASDSAPPYPIHDTESMAGLKTFAETLTTSTQKTNVGVFDTLSAWAAAAPGYSPGSPGYNIAQTQVGAMLAYSEYGSDPTLQALCDSTVLTLNTAYPPDDVFVSGFGYVGYTRAQIWQQTGFVRYGLVERWT
jgi:hypothetical protein